VVGRLVEAGKARSQPCAYGYAYDDRGQLTDVTKDGAPYRSYTYDANGNRTGLPQLWLTPEL
jgi:YD repeat-containing protein